MLNKPFSEVLRRLRNESGISQEELGNRAGLHRTYISQLERGLKSPTLNTLYKICVVLDVELEDFIKQVINKKKREI